MVFVGHVDHGKSTIIGRLLADTESVPQERIDLVRQSCLHNAKPFEYAFLLDTLKDERSQGVTIDSARVFFKTALRDYIIIDAPGHGEFLKNMITGASRAEAAFLVIDAAEGIQENSRRHAYLLSMLGFSNIVVLINKMDIVNYSQTVFESVSAEYSTFLSQMKMTADFIPLSGIEGENLAKPPSKMPWYKGRTLLSTLDSIQKELPSLTRPFRMPVQDVYKFTEDGDTRRIIAGTIELGKISVGDSVTFYPSGNNCKIKTIESYNKPEQTTAIAHQAAAFTLDKPLFVSRGELMTRTDQQPPNVTTRMGATIFWMNKQPLVTGKNYTLKMGTARERIVIEKIEQVIDAETLSRKESKGNIEHHDIADCVLLTDRAVAFDCSHDESGAGRFVIMDGFEICGGGLVRTAMGDSQSAIRNYVFRRNSKWEQSDISLEDRAERYGQKPSLILITGPKNVDKKSIAKAVESDLFNAGRIVSFLGIANVLYGVDADIKRDGPDESKSEHIRRLGEVAHLMLSAGIILVVTATGLTQEDLALLRTTVGHDMTYVVWVGQRQTNIEPDLFASESAGINSIVIDDKTL